MCSVIGPEEMALMAFTFFTSITGFARSWSKLQCSASNDTMKVKMAKVLDSFGFIEVEGFFIAC